MRTERVARYESAREHYSEHGIDTEAALARLGSVSLSLHCWQGDDVGGFERTGAKLEGGGIQATGGFPGRARTLDELRADLDQSLALIPGRHRLNLHAIYGDFGGKPVDRDAIDISHFQSWIDWGRNRLTGLDFNPTFFSHRLAADGFTLSHLDPAVRQFWVEHGRKCRRIAAVMGRSFGAATVTNFWIPDGYKDNPANRRAPRERLSESLDAIFAETMDSAHALDAVESKLFGIGSESYVVGSHEFYLGYAITRKRILCLDMGHFHPTESVADKISSILQFVPEILLHVSRGVRWDSDHVVLFDDNTRALFEEIVQGDFLKRTRVGLDYFDASINRIAAWVIGARNTQKCLLAALLQPISALAKAEEAGDFARRLTLLEESKLMPIGAVWNEFCQRQGVPGDGLWYREAERYERTALRARI